MGFEKIISNSNWKIKNQEEFTIRELVELALTSLMPGNREGIIQQFYILSKMMDNIKFANEDSKVSFYGIILLLSNMYFDRDNPLRKKIQGVFMGKVDCIVEMRKEQFDKGYGKGVLDVAKNMLDSGVSIDFIISKTGLSIEDIEKLKLGK